MAFVALVDMFDVRAGDTLVGPSWPLEAMAKFLRRGKAVFVPDGKEADFVASMASGTVPEYCRNARVRRRRWNWAKRHIGRAVAERSAPPSEAAPDVSSPAGEAPPLYSETTMITKLTKPKLREIGAHYGLEFTTRASKQDMASAILDAQAKRKAAA